MLEEFRKVAASVTYGTPQLPIVSNVTGRLATTEELCSAEYWVRQVRQPGAVFGRRAGARAKRERGRVSSLVRTAC